MISSHADVSKIWVFFKITKTKLPCPRVSLLSLGVVFLLAGWRNGFAQKKLSWGSSIPQTSMVVLFGG